MAFDATKVRVTNRDGILINPSTEDTQLEIKDIISDLYLGGIPANKATDAYSYTVTSETASYTYWFFEDGDGNWYIRRKDKTTGVHDFSKGIGGYESIFVNNTSAPSGVHTWGTYDETFTNVGAGSLEFDIDGNLKVSMEDVTSVNVHTNDSELRVFSHGHICDENSSSIPLGISGVFAGDWQDTLDYSEVIISISADQDSATDGLVVYWSPDGVTSRETDEFSILANKGKTFSFPCNRRYVKLGYTNGVVAQTTFDIQTSLKRFASKGSSHRIKDSIVGDDDAILTKGIVTGVRDDGVFGNAILDNENRLQVNSQDYLYGIAEGAISGHSPLLKFGTRTAILANVQSLIWEGTNAMYTYLTSAENLKVSSSSANDTILGSGVRTLTLVGLDGSFNEITEVINMNGISTVATSNSFIRVFRAYASTVGILGGSNIGNITVTNNGGTNQLLYIPAGDGQTLMTMWTVPLGKVAYITQLTASNDSGKGARFSLFTRLNDGGIIYPWQIKYRAYLVGGNNTIPFNIPFRIPAKTDIEIRFTTPPNAGTTSGGATFELWYEDEEI